jgi:tRNA threonylcarbamoyladenosine biosynthesis protein TsaE
MIYKEIVASLDNIEEVSEYLNRLLPDSVILFLVGDLASGKTTLTQAIAKSKGIINMVSSPTFSLQHCYGDNLFHYDLYRIENSHFMELGLFEEFEKGGWHIIEWGNARLKEFLLSVGYTLYTVTIIPYKEKRKYIIESN